MARRGRPLLYGKRLVMFSAAIPQRFFDRIQADALRRNCSQGIVVREMMTAYFGETSPEKLSPSGLED